MNKNDPDKWQFEGMVACTDDHEQNVDNSRIMMEKLSRCMRDGIMSDVTLVVNNCPFTVHRMILCASSDVFRVMLSNPNFSESHEHRIVLQEGPECGEVFPEFLNYLYSVCLPVP